MPRAPIFRKSRREGVAFDTVDNSRRDGLIEEGWETRGVGGYTVRQVVSRAIRYRFGGMKTTLIPPARCSPPSLARNDSKCLNI
jgi:hypothetical protein